MNNTGITVNDIFVTPELVFEISELSDVNIFEIQDKVQKAFGEHWRFDHTEAKYEDCIMAHFICD